MTTVGVPLAVAAEPVAIYAAPPASLEAPQAIGSAPIASFGAPHAIFRAIHGPMTMPIAGISRNNRVSRDTAASSAKVAVAVAWAVWPTVLNATAWARVQPMGEIAHPTLCYRLARASCPFPAGAGISTFHAPPPSQSASGRWRKGLPRRPVARRAALRAAAGRVTGQVVAAENWPERLAQRRRGAEKLS